jgi:hypothetical protein
MVPETDERIENKDTRRGPRREAIPTAPSTVPETRSRSGGWSILSPAESLFHGAIGMRLDEFGNRLIVELAAEGQIELLEIR